MSYTLKQTKDDIWSSYVIIRGKLMFALSPTVRKFIKIVGTLSLIFVATSLSLLSITNADEPELTIAASDVVQDFDAPNTGTPYTLTAHDPPTHVPAIIAGGPTNMGNMLQLASGLGGASHNCLTFDSTGLAMSGQVVADFDFRLRQETGRADGFGFSFLNIGNYGTTGPVLPQPIAEEPNFTNSLGVGFDIYRSDGPPKEINYNHISVHFSNTKVIPDVDVSPILDLAGGQWVHAQIIVKPDKNLFTLTVKLTQYGRPTGVVIDEQQISAPGFSPYNARVHLASRAFGQHADYDFDNIRVQSLNLTDSILNFSTSSYTVVETEGVAHLTVTRSGHTGGTVSVNYATMDHAATAGSDYTTRSGTLTFNDGEITKTISVPILDDDADEGDEHFLVTLSNPTQNAVLGGPITARVRIVDDERADDEGSWGEPIPTEVIPIQAVLLPTGKIIYWDRSSDTQAWDPQPRLWDPIAEKISRIKPIDYEPFCSGHSLLPNGNLLVTGGHISDTIGEDKTGIYDPETDSWSIKEDMNAGRWYPSNVTLANGDVLVLAGTTFTNTGVFTPDGLNKLPQVWETDNNKWRNLINAEHDPYPAYADYYPYLFVDPDGLVFNAGPQQMARYLNISGTGIWTDVASSSLEYRDYGSAVMYDKGKVMIVGGNPRPTPTQIITPSASAEIIDLNQPTPTWQSAGNMNFGRRHHNATLLPDGKVLVTGGSSAPGFDEDDGAVLAAEMWDPTDLTWTIMASQTLYRGYHSTALLLPDARVLVGGGGHPHPKGGPKYNFEIYSPPYLFKGPRPTIRTAPTKINYGQTFFVETPDANGIKQATWVRLSAVTHGYNQNQRINHLNINAPLGLCGINVTTPANANLAPPGHYMLFLINDKGVPSEGHFVQIGASLNTDTIPAKFCLHLPIISKN